MGGVQDTFEQSRSDWEPVSGVLWVIRGYWMDMKTCRCQQMRGARCDNIQRCNAEMNAMRGVLTSNRRTAERVTSKRGRAGHWH